MEELIKSLKNVAWARQELQRATNAKREALATWEEEHADLIGEIKDLSEVTQEYELRLRELTIKAYQDTGNKKPVDGVGIRELTKLDYDPKEALKWALEHRIALSLDKKTFEGFAKTTPLDFVAVTEELQATIATDLTQYLTE